MTRQTIGLKFIEQFSMAILVAIMPVLIAPLGDPIEQESKNRCTPCSSRHISVQATPTHSIEQNRRARKSESTGAERSSHEILMEAARSNQKQLAGEDASTANAAAGQASGSVWQTGMFKLCCQLAGADMSDMPSGMSQTNESFWRADEECLPPQSEVGGANASETSE
jgi:hypothetical protein